MKLFPHQEELMRTLAVEKSFGVFWQPRVMKTLPMALHITNLMLSDKPDTETCMVIAPLSAIGAWKRDFALFHGKRGEVAKKIVLVNYEKVWRREMYNVPCDIIVLDESHRIANRKSKQSKFILKYNKKSTYRYLMTGTPIGQARLQDLWSQMDFLIPNFFGSYKSFEDKYCITRQLPNSYVKIVVGYRHKEEFLEKIAPHVSFLKLSDVADMPEDMPDNMVICPPPLPVIQKGVENYYVKKYDIIIPSPIVKLGKLRQIASGFIKDEQGETHVLTDTKRKMFGELLDEIGDEKIVVFCDFINSIFSCTHELSRRGISHVVLDGRQKNKEIWKLFQSEDHIKVIVCQYRTANAGIDLWKARNMIFYEPCLSTLMTEQASQRIKKAIDPQPCFYHWLIAKDSIELKIYKQLLKHQDFTLNCLEEWNWVTKDSDKDLALEY